MPLEEVDKLMQDSADAKAYVDELNQMLGARDCWLALLLVCCCGPRR